MTVDCDSPDGRAACDIGPKRYATRKVRTWSRPQLIAHSEILSANRRCPVADCPKPSSLPGFPEDVTVLQRRPSAHRLPYLRPINATDCSRISILRTLPVTVIGNSSTIGTSLGNL